MKIINEKIAEVCKQVLRVGVGKKLSLHSLTPPLKVCVKNRGTPSKIQAYFLMIKL